MNRSIKYVLMLFAFATVVACSGQKESADAAKNDEWPEMDEFHMLMAESFHPYKDSSNVEPAIANAAAMADMAKKWTLAPLPKKVDTEGVKTTLSQLRASTATFVKTAQSGDKMKIGKELTSLHDLFHQLQDAWYGSSKKHH